MQKLKIKRTKRMTLTITETVEYFFSNSEARTDIAPQKKDDKEKSETVIAVTISQVRKG